MLKSRKSDRQVMAVTYGRGIFTSNFFGSDCPPSLHLVQNPMMDQSYFASDTITSVTQILAPWTVDYYSGDVVELWPGFQVNLGAAFQVSISNCEQ